MARTLFVVDQDVADRRVEDRVVDGQDGPAGEAEHDLHVLHLEALDQCLCSGEFHRVLPCRRWLVGTVDGGAGPRPVTGGRT